MQSLSQSIFSAMWNEIFYERINLEEESDNKDNKQCLQKITTTIVLRVFSKASIFDADLK